MRLFLTLILILVVTPALALQGTIRSVGSDSMNSLLQAWSQAFSARHPMVRFEIQASGSSSAAIALREGTTDIGPMSRRFTRQEQNGFRDNAQAIPLIIPVAMDALAVFVHRHNPVSEISIAQLDGIFSATLLCGTSSPITDWSQLDSRLQPAPIKAHGRNSVSGTYAKFRELALCRGDYANSVGVQMGTGSILRLVGLDPHAIGYAPLGLNSPAVKALAIASQGEAVKANPETVADGRYPLARTLYIAVQQAPDQSIPAHIRAFLKFVRSDDGQSLAERQGFVRIAHAPGVVSDIDQFLQLIKHR